MANNHQRQPTQPIDYQLLPMVIVVALMAATTKYNHVILASNADAQTKPRNKIKTTLTCSENVNGCKN